MSLSAATWIALSFVDDIALLALSPYLITSGEITMAAKSAAVKPAAFDIAAYLAADSAPKQSLLSMIGQKLDNAAQATTYRAGKFTESLSGTGEIFELGKKVGAVDSAARIQAFKARATAEITAKLAQMED